MKFENIFVFDDFFLILTSNLLLFTTICLTKTTQEEALYWLFAFLKKRYLIYLKKGSK